ncbi:MULTISPECIES: LPS export ABC transporter permease LptG [Gammaproteobacteria]|uniref:LPS export ABC transporter permease LptG n=1 Tax=Gammaproteobacteria TaxID=1236 RepID=UPI000DD03162|nr:MULTISPECIES: LPS export ABC transporter permease LptG [Gammaproteobacteria]RTE87675.1 lipopolysaccharide ABC transporter permease LptG [Aliidiomarina sp. B3213]TCZ92541.1 lipopolysaccharide ABC transporter permease LptG [Lysobacter sp. N42]
MISILDRYIGKTVILMSFVSLGVLTGLSTLIRFVEQLRAIGRGTYDMMDVLAFVLLSVPRDVEMFFPMATLLGGLLGMGALANNSELVVMMAAGRSKLNLMGSVMKASVVMMIAVLAIGEWVAPEAEAEARQLRAQAVSGGALISAPQGVWAKDGDAFIHIDQVENTGSLNDISVYEFQDLELVRVIRSEHARYISNDWVFDDVTITEFSEQQVTTEEVVTMPWSSGLTPEKLGVVTVKPESLPISGLLEYVGYLRDNNQSASRYELALWRKVFAPVTVAVMLLVALSFIFGPLRSVTMGARVLLGVITGFVFYVSNEVFGPFAQVYQVPPALAAIMPSLLFASAALYFLVKQRRA